MFTTLRLFLICTLAATALLVPRLTFAQGYQEGLNASFELLPLTVKNTVNGSENKSDFTAHITRVNFAKPFFLKPDKSQYLILGVNTELFNFSGDRPNFNVSHLYSIAPTIGYSRRLSDKFSASAIFLPSLNSDYDHIKGGDIQYGGIVRGVYKVRPNLALRAALGYRQQFSGGLYIVQVGLDWQVSDKLRIFGDAPTSLTINYAASPKLNYGFDLLANNSAYRLATENQYVSYKYANTGLFAEYNLTPNLALRAKVGYSLIRNLDVYRDGEKADAVDVFTIGTKPEPISAPLEKGAVYRLQLSYRVFTK